MMISKKASFVMLASVTLGIASALLVSSPSANANGADKVEICHMPGTPAAAVRSVPSAAVPGHLSHGDYVMGGGGGQSSSAAGSSCQ